MIRKVSIDEDCKICKGQGFKTQMVLMPGGGNLKIEKTIICECVRFVSVDRMIVKKPG